MQQKLEIILKKGILSTSRMSIAVTTYFLCKKQPLPEGGKGLKRQQGHELRAM
jgi:hypothetical protein